MFPVVPREEVFDVRPPMSLEHVVEMNPDMPEDEVHRELRREWAHRISVRVMVRDHRIARDFFTAWLVHVQGEVGSRRTLQCMVQRVQLRFVVAAF
jgi:hypothetical protein